MVWDEAGIKEYQRIISDLAHTYGIPVIEQQVTKVINQGGFLDAGNLRAGIGTVERTYCPRCRHRDGWIYVLVDGETMPRAYKCQHDPSKPTMQVKIGPSGEQHQVTAVSCDYADGSL